MNKRNDTQLMQSAVGFTGFDTAGIKIRSDKLGVSARGQIFEAVAAAIDGRISGRTFAGYLNDYREGVRRNGGTKGQLEYAAKQAKAAAKKAGRTLETKQATETDGSMRYTAAAFPEIVGEIASEAPETGATDSAGRQDSDADVGRGIDHEVIADKLQAWVHAGASPETILGHLLDVSVPAEKQVQFLRDVADRLESRNTAPRLNPNAMESAIVAAICNA